MSKLRKTNLVAQSNDLINARFKVSKNEFSLLNSMISLLEPDHKEFPVFTVGIKELAGIMGIDKKSAISELDKITDRLMKRVSRIITAEGDYAKFTWLNSVIVSSDRSLISLQFHNFLKPYLLDLKERGNFTQYRLEQILKFNSFYSDRMYGVLAENKAKKIYKFERSLDDFKQAMMGHGSTSYPLYKNFRNNVLDVAQKELSEKDPITGLYKSDLGFDIETRRTGRKISHLVFTVKTQQTKPILNKSKAIENEKEDAPQIILDYEFYGLNRSIVKPFLEERGEKSLVNTLEKFKKDKEKGVIKKNEQGYLRHLLKTEAGQKTESEKTDKEEKKQKFIDDAEKIKLKKKDDFIEKYKKDFSKNEVNKFIENLTSESMEKFIIDISFYYKNDGAYVLNFVKKRDFCHPALRVGMKSFISGFEEKEKNYIQAKLAENGF